MTPNQKSTTLYSKMIHLYSHNCSLPYCNQMEKHLSPFSDQTKNRISGIHLMELLIVRYSDRIDIYNKIWDQWIAFTET